MAPPRPGAPPTSPAEIDSSLFAVLLSADSAREGAAELLAALAPVLDDAPAAIAVRDRDALTLHVLAEAGVPHTWPARLEPQVALGAKPAVDAETGVMVAPLRANGRVVGALLIGDAPAAVSLLHQPDLPPLLETTAAILSTIVSRAEAEARRRAWARHTDAIVSGMAHQITNPLTGATAIAELLVEELEDQGQRAAVLQIRHELSRAFGVLRDLLEFQRDTHAHDGVLDLNAIAERLVRFRGYAIREQGIALALRTSGSFLPVHADARALQHAILAALRFAELRSHGTVNRQIDVSVTERGVSELAVQITDSGTGLIPEISPVYFDVPVLRADQPPGHEGPEHPDLGLVDSLLRASGGRLEVTGSKTDGTTLTLVLPRASASSRALDPPTRQAPTPTSQRRNSA